MQPEKFKSWSAKKGEIINAGKYFKCAIYNHFYFRQIKSEWNFIKIKYKLKTDFFLVLVWHWIICQANCLTKQCAEDKKWRQSSQPLSSMTNSRQDQAGGTKLLWITRKKILPPICKENILLSQ